MEEGWVAWQSAPGSLPPPRMLEISLPASRKEEPPPPPPALLSAASVSPPQHRSNPRDPEFVGTMRDVGV